MTAADSLDNAEIEIPCPKCGKESKQTVGRLKNDPKLTCPHCRFVFHVEAKQLRELLRKVNKSLDDLPGKR